MAVAVKHCVLCTDDGLWDPKGVDDLGRDEVDDRLHCRVSCRDGYRPTCEMLHTYQEIFVSCSCLRQWACEFYPKDLEQNLDRSHHVHMVWGYLCHALTGIAGLYVLNDLLSNFGPPKPFHDQLSRRVRIQMAHSVIHEPENPHTLTNGNHCQKFSTFPPKETVFPHGKTRSLTSNLPCLR